MSIGPMNAIAASVAGTPLAQTRGPDVERAGQDLGVQQHAVQGELTAESASGVGETDGEEHQTGERDADGRLPWKIQVADKETGDDEDVPAGPPAKDPAGQSGNLLDLSG